MIECYRTLTIDQTPDILKKASVSTSNSTRESLKQFVSLQAQIFAEREKLLGRLTEIDSELGRLGFNATIRHYGLHTPTGRVRNQKSLKELVIEVLSKKALTKEGVLDAVLRAGYQFSSSDPMNSLGVVLYGKNPVFKRLGRKFAVEQQP